MWQNCKSGQWSQFNSYFKNLEQLNTIIFHDVGHINREERIPLHAHSVAGVLRVLFFLLLPTWSKIFHDLHVCIAPCSALLPLYPSGLVQDQFPPPSSGKIFEIFEIAKACLSVTAYARICQVKHWLDIIGGILKTGRNTQSSNKCYHHFLIYSP